MNKDSFILYRQQWRGLKELSEAELGRLMAGIYRVLNEEDIEDVERGMPDAVLIAFRFMMTQITLDRTKFFDKLQANKERQERYRAKQKSNAHTETETVTGTETETETVTETETETETGSIAVEKKEAAAAAEIDSSFLEMAQKQFLPWFNRLVSQNESTIPKLKVMTPARAAQLHKIFHSYAREDIEECFRRAVRSTFLNGKGRKNKFVATFDWIIDDENFLKVMEGNYNI